MNKSWSITHEAVWFPLTEKNKNKSQLEPTRVPQFQKHSAMFSVLRTSNANVIRHSKEHVAIATKNMLKVKRKYYPH